MKTAQGVAPAYNAQAMVSLLATGEGVTGMLITSVDVVDEGNDYARLLSLSFINVAPQVHYDASIHQPSDFWDCDDESRATLGSGLTLSETGIMPSA